MGDAAHSPLACSSDLLCICSKLPPPLPMRLPQMTPTAMSEVPTIPPPFGVASQFDDPPSQTATLVIVSSISLALMVICSVLQVYTRTFLLGLPFGLEDGKYEILLCR